MSSGQNHQEWLKKFHPDQWKELTVEDRKNALIELETYMAKQQGRSPCSVEFEPMEASYGYYDCGEIVINESMLKDDDGLHDLVLTMLHEGRHAWQDNVLPKLQQPSPEEQKVLENLRGGYLQHSYLDYYMQPLEKDAESYALQEFRALYEQLKSWGLEDPEAVRKGNEIQWDLVDAKIDAEREYGPDFENVLLWKSKAKAELLNHLQLRSNSDRRFMDFAAEKYLADTYRNYGMVFGHKQFLKYVMDNKVQLQKDYNEMLKNRGLNALRPVFSMTAEQAGRNDQSAKEQPRSLRNTNSRANRGDEDMGLSM